jgi:hypothetical protein
LRIGNHQLNLIESADGGSIPPEGCLSDGEIDP